MPLSKFRCLLKKLLNLKSNISALDVSRVVGRVHGRPTQTVRVITLQLPSDHGIFYILREPNISYSCTLLKSQTQPRYFCQVMTNNLLIETIHSELVESCWTYPRIHGFSCSWMMLDDVGWSFSRWKQSADPKPSVVEGEFQTVIGRPIRQLERPCFFLFLRWRKPTVASKNVAKHLKIGHGMAEHIASHLPISTIYLQQLKRISLSYDWPTMGPRDQEIDCNHLPTSTLVSTGLLKNMATDFLSTST